MKKIIITLTTIVLSLSLFAQQGNVIEQEVDPSKPTNLYTQLNTNLESSFSDSQNLFALLLLEKHNLGYFLMKWKFNFNNDHHEALQD